MARIMGAFEAEFENLYGFYANALISAPTIVQPPHQMDHLEDNPNWVTREVTNQVLVYHIPPQLEDLQSDVKPNLPWAEDHFQERVSGEPLNPPPSAVAWPFTVRGHEKHVKGGKFSHTYPERMWPQIRQPSGDVTRMGIRFPLGDLNDLVQLLARNPYTRQAYLPIWFPEDLTAAKQGERVPCTLGYHFLLREGKLNITYFIRSCDLVRFFRDDVYMACRLVQWVCEKAFKGHADVGILTMHICSLHCFEGDLTYLRKNYAS